MPDFDKAFADKVLVVSDSLARDWKFVDMETIEAVLHAGAAADAEAARERISERLAALTATSVPIDTHGVQIGDLVHVPRGVDVVCETGYRIRVAELSGYGAYGPRIKADGNPMISRSVTSESGFVERVVPWHLIPQCTVTRPEPAADSPDPVEGAVTV